MNEQINSAIRSILKMAGAYMAARGVNVDSSAWEAIGGGIIAIAGVAWSWWHHSKAASKPNE